MRKRHFPRLFVLFLLIVLCALSACGAPAPAFDRSQQESSVTASADDIATAIIQQTPIDHMVALESETISLHYDFDLSLLDDYAVYMSTVNTSADEIAIFHLKEGTDSQVIIRALNACIQMKMRTFQTLAPKEYEKLSHALLLSNGDYIALLVCPKIETAYSILTENYHFPAMTNAAAKKGAILARKED
uniref:DUF4358 domain-containing protein n=1 Tax=Candidatus Fimivicinus sp. TaxID=3056640 RepID=UPI003FF08CBE